MDFLGVPKVQILVCFVYFLSGILGHYHIASGDLFLYGKKKGSQYDPWYGSTIKYIKNRQSPMWCRGLLFSADDRLSDRERTVMVADLWKEAVT